MSRKSRTTAPVGETKEAKSTRLAAARMTAVLEKLELVGNLNSNAYSLTGAQIDVMEATLNETVARVIGKLRKELPSGFTFPQPVEAVEEVAKAA